MKKRFPLIRHIMFSVISFTPQLIAAEFEGGSNTFTTASVVAPATYPCITLKDAYQEYMSLHNSIKDCKTFLENQRENEVVFQKLDENKDKFKEVRINADEFKSIECVNMINTFFQKYRECTLVVDFEAATHVDEHFGYFYKSHGCIMDCGTGRLCRTDSTVKKVKIVGEHLISIGGYCLLDIGGIESFEMPKSITSIGAGFFFFPGSRRTEQLERISLKSVTLPSILNETIQHLPKKVEIFNND